MCAKFTNLNKAFLKEMVDVSIIYIYKDGVSRNQILSLINKFQG